MTPSRSAALAILLALLALIGGGIVLPYARLVGELDDSVDQRRATLARYEDLARAVSKQSVAAPQLAALEVNEASAAQAAARVQETVASVARSAGFNLDGMQVLRDDRPEAGRLALRLRGAGGIAAVQRFLYAVDANRPILIVDNLRIQVRSGAITADAPLDVQLDVIAFPKSAP
jgi:Type II secretion system (T2SS), protein M subtype b